MEHITNFKKGTTDDNISRDVKEKIDNMLLESFVDNMNELKEDIRVSIKITSFAQNKSEEDNE